MSFSLQFSCHITHKIRYVQAVWSNVSTGSHYSDIRVHDTNTTTLTKSNPYNHVLSCSALFSDLLWRYLFKKAWRIDAQTLRPLKQLFLFTKESKTTTPTKSKPFSHILSCSAIFNDLLWRSLCKKKSRTLHNYYWLFLGRFFLNRALYAIAFSVLDTGIMYLRPWV